MSYRALVIGTAPSLKSSRARELEKILEDQGVAFTALNDAASKFDAKCDLIFFMSLDSKPARPLQQWIDLIKARKLSGRAIVLYAQPLAQEWRQILDPEIEIGEEHDLAESIAYLFEESGAQHPTSVDVPTEALGSRIEPSADELPPPADAFGDSSADFSIKIEPGAEGGNLELTETRLEPMSEVFQSFESEAPAEAAPLSSDDFGSFDPDEEIFSADPSPGAPVGFSQDPETPSPDLILHPDEDIRAPLAGRDTFNADIDLNEVLGSSELGTHVGPSIGESEESEAAPLEAFDPHVEASGIPSGADIATVQKYAALREREAREKEATIQVLKGQVSKLDAKLSRSENERRRLTLSNDETKTLLSALEENLSQKQFHIQKMESSHQEELRGLSLRLDNAIFQATKAQGKLDEFRERVRNDFMKIRAQERELFNKLELQKRDAEALLASKDEQLLQQKREIDRLQYESETLRERLIEETERAEERASRLTRAVQSLKLANDMLSGLSEEVLPAAGDNFGNSRGDGEDAA